jgi:hypothetical protein
MFLGSLVEYVTCVNIVSNASVHYDYSKHIPFYIILLLPFIIKIIRIRSATFFECHILLVTYSRYLKDVVRANCLECTDRIRIIYGCVVNILLLLHYTNQQMGCSFSRL